MSDHEEDYMSGRKIYWCPSYEGFISYCPRPTDPDEYSYCCSYYWKEMDMPSCCRYPFHTGVIIAAFLSVFVFLFTCTFMTCWCWPSCPIAKRLQNIRRRQRSEEGR